VIGSHDIPRHCSLSLLGCGKPSDDSTSTFVAIEKLLIISK